VSWFFGSAAAGAAATDVLTYGATVRVGWMGQERLTRGLLLPSQVLRWHPWQYAKGSSRGLLVLQIVWALVGEFSKFLNYGSTLRPVIPGIS